MEFVKLLDASLPQPQKYAGFDPSGKAVVGRGLGTEFGLIQGGPLAARPQDVEDRVGTATV